MVKTGVSDEQIKEKVFIIPGPFVTRRRVYNSFSSAQRPTPQQTEDCLKKLEESDLGKCLKVGKTLVFYKELPSVMRGKEEDLAKIKMTADRYKNLFISIDDLVPQDMAEKFMNNHPNVEDLSKEGYVLPV